MDILISHLTALSAMRRWELRRDFDPLCRSAMGVPASIPSSAEASRILSTAPFLEDLPHPLHVCAQGVRARRSDLIAHPVAIPLPHGSVIGLGHGLLCVSPEHLVVQVARYLTDLELMMLLAELMGTYAIDPDRERGFFTRNAPLATVESIRMHLDALGRFPGTARVRRLLGMTCENAASPREAKLYLRIALKPSLGGYHLPVAAVNQPIMVPRLGKPTHRGIRKPDLLLLPPALCKGGRFRGVTIEYDGSDHYDRRQHTVDTTRRSELQAIGLIEYGVNRDQYRDLAYMDGLDRCIRRDLGMRASGLTIAEQGRRRRLRERLFIDLERIDGMHWSRGEEIGGPSCC